MKQSNTAILTALIATLPWVGSGFVVGPYASSPSATVASHQPLTQRRRQEATSLSLIGYRNKGVLQKDEDNDDEDLPTEVGEIKGIDRTWTDGDFVPGGEIDMDVFYPEDSSGPKGAVFFMHGFSQYPKAYAKTLRKLASQADVVVFAVETGVTTNVSQGPLFSNQQFWLQRAVSSDTIQLIEMMKDGEFSDIVDKDVPVGLCGHSMGGGLCFYVADQFPNDIDYVFAMAPAYGVAPFDPVNATKKTVAANSLLLAGSWDLIAPADKVETLVVNSNKKDPESSIYGLIKRGIHTGFEDRLVIINIPLTFILAFILKVDSILEYLLLRLFTFIRTSTGQLEITNELMTFFFQQMVAGNKVTLEDAMNAVSEDLKDKITMSSPSV